MGRSNGHFASGFGILIVIQFMIQDFVGSFKYRLSDIHSERTEIAEHSPTALPPSLISLAFLLFRIIDMYISFPLQLWNFAPLSFFHSYSHSFFVIPPFFPFFYISFHDFFCYMVLFDELSLLFLSFSPSSLSIPASSSPLPLFLIFSSFPFPLSFLRSSRFCSRIQKNINNDFLSQIRRPKVW